MKAPKRKVREFVEEWDKMKIELKGLIFQYRDYMKLTVEEFDFKALEVEQLHREARKCFILKVQQWLDEKKEQEKALDQANELLK